MIFYYVCVFIEENWAQKSGRELKIEKTGVCVCVCVCVCMCGCVCVAVGVCGCGLGVLDILCCYSCSHTNAGIRLNTHKLCLRFNLLQILSAATLVKLCVRWTRKISLSRCTDHVTARGSETLCCRTRYALPSSSEPRDWMI